MDISKAVLQHFEDIGHDYNDHSVVFENGQAREDVYKRQPQLPMARTFTLPVLSRMVFSDTATSLSSSIITMFMSRPPFSQVLFRHRQKNAESLAARCDVYVSI